MTAPAAAVERGTTTSDKTTAMTRTAPDRGKVGERILRRAARRHQEFVDFGRCMLTSAVRCSGPAATASAAIGLRSRDPARSVRDAEHVVDESVFLGPRGVEIEVGALGIPDDLTQGLAGAGGHDAVNLALHLLEAVEMLRRGGGGLPARPFRRLVDHDPGVRKAESLPWARGLKHDGAHRVGHPLDDDRDFDAGRNDLLNGVMHGQPVGDVATCGVDVELDRSWTVVGQLPDAFDRGRALVLLDIADEIDVAKALRRSFFRAAFTASISSPTSLSLNSAIRQRMLAFRVPCELTRCDVGNESRNTSKPERPSSRPIARSRTGDPDRVKVSACSNLGRHRSLPGIETASRIGRHGLSY